MKLIIDTTIDEFCSYCVNLLKDDKKTFLEALNQTVNYAFESSLRKDDRFIYIKRIDNLYISSDNDHLTPFNISTSNRGSINWIKYKIDFKKSASLTNITIELPEYLKMENNSPNQNKYWVKIKELKTKNCIFIDFIRIKFNNDLIEKIGLDLGETFFDEHMHILGGYKHSVIQSNTNSKENLPLPYVAYPDSVGVFIGFKERRDSSVIFCECQKKAIENYIYMRLFGKSNRENDQYHFDQIMYHNEIDRRFIFDPVHFPIQFIQDLHSKKYTQDITIIDHIQFASNICHECNKKMPNYNYCVPYTKFYRSYGWYVNKRIIEYGISINTLFLELPDRCPEHIRLLYTIIEPKLYHFPSVILNDSDTVIIEEKYNQKIDELIVQVNNIKHTVRNEIENEVRDSFGYKRIGEEWISETLLYKEIKKAFNNEKVIHHGKPEWLGKQHLDIWMPDRMIALEYQGAQHYRPVNRFGGEEGFLKTLERDRKKKELCEQNNVKLFYVDEEDSIPELIKKIHLTTAST